MAISSYEINGETFWKVYVNIRSKEDSAVREQKLVRGIGTQKAALAEEKRLLRELTEKISTQTSQGLSWDAVIDKWCDTMKTERAYYKYEPGTLVDHVNCLKRWTADWLLRPAATLSRADARNVLAQLEEAGKPRGFQKRVKHTVNVVFRWGVEERIIRGTNTSPMEGVKVSLDKAEKVPDIFTIDEIRKLLRDAKALEHHWYPIWATALLTGMRNGELHALLWSDIDFENRKITVSKSYNTRYRKVKSTKAGYWRTVPISDELSSLLRRLKATTGEEQHVLPRSSDWDKGEQAAVLKKFCAGIGIRPIKFHALRACFATQLLAHDVAPAQVMKVCGWRELKTMQYYVRLAGVDERGATQALRILPSDALMGEVVDILGMKAQA